MLNLNVENKTSMLKQKLDFWRGCNAIIGSCVLKASVDRVSVDTLGRYVDRQSADISTDTRPTYRPRLDRYSVDMLFELKDRRSTLSVGMSVDTIGRYVGRHSADTSADMSLVYRSTVGGIGVLLTVVLLK